MKKKNERLIKILVRYILQNNKMWDYNVKNIYLEEKAEMYLVYICVSKGIDIETLVLTCRKDIVDL